MRCQAFTLHISASYPEGNSRGPKASAEGNAPYLDKIAYTIVIVFSSRQPCTATGSGRVLDISAPTHVVLGEIYLGFYSMFAFSTLAKLPDLTPTVLG
jgi:hypothetical protein